MALVLGLTHSVWQKRFNQNFKYIKNFVYWVLPSQKMGKSLEIAALPNFFYFRFLVPRLVQHKIVAKQILQISCVSIKLILGNTWNLRTLWHNKILRTIKDQFFRHFYLLIWNCNNIDLELKMNPLHPNITKGHFHTVLHTFFKVPTRRICVTINSFCCW